VSAEWCRHDDARQQGIERNLSLVAELEAKAVRVTTGPVGRCFEMPGGRLMTIANEQQAGSSIEHIQQLLPLSREDAEDFYGWYPLDALNGVGVESL
jgi:hypothetical protein